MMPDLIKLIKTKALKVNNKAKVTHNIQLTWKLNLPSLRIRIRIKVYNHVSLFSRDLGRMSVRGLDPTCPSTIKREPSSPSPSSQGDISPAQPSPGSSSSDTNSSYGPLIKGHNHSDGLDSPSPYGHTVGLVNNVGTKRYLGFKGTCKNMNYQIWYRVVLYGTG